MLIVIAMGNKNLWCRKWKVRVCNITLRGLSMAINENIACCKNSQWIKDIVY